MPRGEVKIALFALLVTFFIKDGYARLVERIVNGVEARSDEVMYQVELFRKVAESDRTDGTDRVAFQPYCGGALIRKEVVATAAHCLYKRSINSIVVGAGSNDLESPTMEYSNVTGIETFAYDRPSKQRDLVLLGLEKGFGENVRPIGIVGKDFNGTGKICTVSGFGLTGYRGERTKRLRKVEVTYHSAAKCAKMFHNKTKLYNSTFMGCAGGGDSDACQGDSGGPLVCTTDDGIEKLAGVVSFGIKCAQKGTPGAYTKIQALTEAINCKADALEGKRESNTCEYFDPKRSVEV